MKGAGLSLVKLWLTWQLWGNPTNPLLAPGCSETGVLWPSIKQRCQNRHILIHTDTHRQNRSTHLGICSHTASSRRTTIGWMLCHACSESIINFYGSLKSTDNNLFMQNDVLALFGAITEAIRRIMRPINCDSPNRTSHHIRRSVKL